MSVLFVYDHCFMIKNVSVYSHTFGYELFKPYVEVFSKITIVARSVDVGDVEGAHISMGEGVEFVFMENISTFGSFFGLRQDISKQMQALIDTHDTVIVRLPSELGLMASNLAHEMHKKYLIEVVGCAWDAMWNYGGIKAKIYAPYFFLKVKNSLDHAYYATYVTTQFLQGRYPASEYSKTIGVSDVVLAKSDEKTLSRRIQKIEKIDGKVIFGTIGSLSVKYKGIESALIILGKIASKYDNFEYRILGEGDPGVYITVASKLGIADKVFFDGLLPRGEEVDAWLDRIDIYLQPSLTEGLPRSLIEAMSRGCPSLASSVGGIPELLDKKVLFSSMDREEMFEKIEALMYDKQKMRDLAEENFNKAKAYQQKELDKKRKRFWIDFRDDLA